MSLRRSTRLRAYNHYNNKENTLDISAWASNGTNARRSTVRSVAGSTKNTRGEDTCTIGLQRPDGHIVALEPSYVLGRSNQPPQLPRVDLGLTNDNAIHVSKTACVVESVTSQQAVLVIPKAVTKKRVYKPKINRGGIMIPPHHGKLTIHTGDTLIFPTGHDYPNHSFAVVRVDAKSSKGETSTKAATNVAANDRVLLVESKHPRTLWPSSKTTEVETVETLMSPKRPSQPSTPSAVDNVMESPHHHRQQEANGIESPTKRLRTTEPPSASAPPTPGPTITLDEIKRQEQNAWRAPELVADRHKTKLGDDDDGDDDDEEDYYDCHEDPTNRVNARPRDMHVTFANTYWKALCSDTPSIGAKLLHLLLDNQRLPTIKLCGDLLKLITFGETTVNSTSNNLNSMNSKTDAHKTRRHLAYQYIEATLYQYPQVAYDRFGDAAGSDYWKNVLEQLYTVKNDQDHHHHHHSRRHQDESTPETVNVIAANLTQQILSVKLFHRLLNGMIHRRDLSSSPILRDMHHYGHSATCKVAANVMAHVWVEWGTHLWTSSNLTPHVYELTNILAKIMILLLQKFVVPSTSMATTTTSHYKTKKASTTSTHQHQWKESTEILWNAMNGKIQMSPHHRDKAWTRDLKLYWLQSWKEHPELEEALAKHLKLWREYKQS